MCLFSPLYLWQLFRLYLHFHNLNHRRILSVYLSISLHLALWTANVHNHWTWTISLAPLMNFYSLISICYGCSDSSHHCCSFSNSHSSSVRRTCPFPGIVLIHQCGPAAIYSFTLLFWLSTITCFVPVWAKGSFFCLVFLLYKHFLFFPHCSQTHMHTRTLDFASVFPPKTHRPAHMHTDSGKQELTGFHFLLQCNKHVFEVPGLLLKLASNSFSLPAVVSTACLTF